jgi:hypothetical protein
MAIPSYAQRERTFVIPADTSYVEKKSDTLTVAKVWKWSLIAPSFGQFFNRQYWKTPIVLGGIGGMVYGAVADPKRRAGYIIGAGVFYWTSLLDGTFCYRYDKGEHLPSKAAIYSTLLPGLGQAYNQKYWKLPLVYGGFLGLGYLIQSRNFRLNLYSKAYNLAYNIREAKKELAVLQPETAEYDNLQAQINDMTNQIHPPFRTLSADNLKSYKDKNRRDRDFYIILTCLWYGLNIVDAAVDAHLFTYDISNNLSFQWSPFVERTSDRYDDLATGLSFSIRF